MRYIPLRKDLWTRLSLDNDNDPLVIMDRSNAVPISLSGQLMMNLISDSPLRHAKDATVERQKKFAVILKGYTYGEMCAILKQYASLLMSQVDDMERYAAVDHRFYTHFPLYAELKAWSTSHDPDLWRFLAEFCTFAKKTRIENPQLREQSLQKWLLVDKEIEPSWFGSSRASALRRIVQRFLNKFDPYTPCKNFMHGPGRVAELPGKHLGAKCTLNTAFRPYVDWVIWNHSEEDVYQYLYEYGLLVDDIPTKTRDKFHDDEGRRISALTMFVDKYTDANRSICAEPCPLMYHQKSVQVYLYEQFDKYLHTWISLKDQSHNKAAAQHGSVYKDLGTLDLSDASDTVGYELAVHLFSGHPIGELILALRSASVELPDGSHYVMKKFAPMGSALCFPIQCIIFLAVCLVTGDEMGGSEYYAHPRVYGDDIIVDSRLYEETLEMLAYFGFKPNMSKSYGGNSPFRESCGGWYLDGADVTPSFPKLAKAKIKESGPQTNLGTSGLFALYSRLYVRGWKATAHWLLRFIKEKHLRGRPLIFALNPSRDNELQTSVIPHGFRMAPSWFYNPQRDAKGHFRKDTKPYYGGTYVYATGNVRYRRRKATYAETVAFDLYRYRRWWSARTTRVLQTRSSTPKVFWPVFSDIPEAIELSVCHPKTSVIGLLVQPIPS